VSVDVVIPNDAVSICVVIDRGPLEELPREDVCCRTYVFIKEQSLGHLGYVGGRADYSGLRPGRVGLWSYTKRSLMENRVARIVFKPVCKQHVRAHVDFF
jgi:hypothetical protein